ncbi:MAG: ATP-binding protein [Candidatus Peregrinibacteria bacterium]|nr:ATP-binding protein [Candidatus Peregrinibacteria bacterium]MDZ4244724.1 ATP-binding protein [Candidatus Gracilibacteria bacterium]
MEEAIKQINELRRLPSETEWVEFKSNHQPPGKIGEYISALANSACLHQRSEAYLVFGIENKTHKVIGTKYEPRTTKGKGAEDLEPWLHRNLKPKIDFKIQEIEHPDGRVVIFFIQPAFAGPVKFNNKAWIRISSSTKALDEFPEKEAIIWERRTPFEDKLAKENVSESDAIELLEFDQYFRLTGETRPKNQTGIIEKLLQEEFLAKKKGKLNITNLGGILLARNLENFPKLRSKAVRIISYKGTNKLHAIKDETFNRGYAVGFGDIISYIQSQIPEPEKIEGGLRSSKVSYPPNAIREFVANALVHQDFLVTGSTPLVEIFENRIEISNPGKALIPTDRFIDHPPKSRNEKLSDMLRRMKICEKRGSGVDRAMFAIELSQLPPPNIEDQKNDGLRVTIYSQKELSKLTKEEQCRACYFHSCIQHVINQESLTNASLCKRLGIEDKNKAIASRIIKRTIEKGWIKVFDPDNKSNRYKKYIPYWG